MRGPAFALLAFLLAAAACRAQAPVRVMPLGDSITQGNTAHASYRRPLWHRLADKGYRVDFVGSLREHHGAGRPLETDFDRDHEGHWGWRADQFLEQAEAWARAARPDIVLVHLGTNDAYQGQDAESTLDELGRLVAALRSANPELTVVLSQLIPVDEQAMKARGKAGVNERINAINRGIPALAKSLATAKSPVIAVDARRGFDPSLDTHDGVHPNHQGESKIAQVWFEALEALLKEPYAE